VNIRSTGWPAPAKLNLCLYVTGRRADGYHELQTAFQLLDYGDELAFTVRSDGVIDRPVGVPGVVAEEDLVVRAARLLRDAAGRPAQGVSIEVLKRLPAGGGLGGGSSDAATTLVALNELWGLGLSRQDLARLGIRLGADVPLFVDGRSAWAEGVGEELTPLSLPPAWYTVVFPGHGSSTRDVFQAPELTRNSPKVTMGSFLAQLVTGQGLRNDLEPVVRARHDGVRQALEWLGQRGTARLTGSGACVFAAFPTESAAQGAAIGVPAGWTSFVARGVDRSPLLDRGVADG
jgi:4-diphosphocytidyl-2-C-methyl-D-erythritol kinase